MTEQFARDQLALEIANKDAKKQEIAKKKDESAAKKLKKQEELEKKRKDREAVKTQRAEKPKPVNKPVNKRVNKKKTTTEDLKSKRCFKCELNFEESSEDSKPLWRNCEKTFSCNNWYCSDCLPDNFSNSDELNCSICREE